MEGCIAPRTKTYPATAADPGVVLPAKRLERLRALGLAEYPARAYLALLELGPANARAVADRSGVPRGKIYATLNDLHVRGLVEVTPERPHRYVAAPVVELLASLRRTHRDALERLTRDEQTLVREFGAAPLPAPPPLGAVAVVRGRRNFVERLRLALDGARGSVLVATTAPGLSRLADELDVLADARDRGVDVLVRAPLAEAGPGPRATLAAVARLVDAPALAPEVTVLVVDRVEAILHRAVPDDAKLYRGDDLSVLLQDARLAEALASVVARLDEAHGSAAEKAATSV